MLLPQMRPKTLIYSTLLLVPVFYFSLVHLAPAVRNQIWEWQEWHSPNRYIKLSDYPYKYDREITTNLVIASTKKDDTSWTEHLRVPGLNVVRYVSDDPSAKFHPPVAKGREALMYFTYLHDFYDDLPDISIFIHFHETEWHIDSPLKGSMIFTLSRLALEQVLKREYFNLRVSWKDACPDWINTTKSVEETKKHEEPWVAPAMRANFGNDVQVPEIIAGPCCSQFAVTRDAIQRNSKEQYKRHMDWLIETEWPDYTTGRVWEHMWPWLFKGEAKDCAIEWKALCQMYGICFESAAALQKYEKVWESRKNLREETAFFNELWSPSAGRNARRRIKKFEEFMDRKLDEAIERGKDPAVRQDALRDMYIDHQ